jgi:hypothetical protein
MSFDLLQKWQNEQQLGLDNQRFQLGRFQETGPYRWPFEL